MPKTRLVLDTNVFVAAGFNSESASARIIGSVRAGDLKLIWNEETRRETRAVVEQIPPLSWTSFSGLFREGGRYRGKTEPEKIGYVPDPADRKFAALARATESALVTNDDDLRANRDGADIYIVTPTEFLERRR
jgi:predicted nucleic acid-binding protein